MLCNAAHTPCCCMRCTAAPTSAVDHSPMYFVCHAASAINFLQVVWLFSRASPLTTSMPARCGRLSCPLPNCPACFLPALCYPLLAPAHTACPMLTTTKFPRAVLPGKGAGCQCRRDAGQSCAQTACFARRRNLMRDATPCDRTVPNPSHITQPNLCLALPICKPTYMLISS